MEYTPLRYISELALAGMKDGPAPHSYRSPIGRIQLLLSYKNDWPKLHWMHELKQLIHPHARAGVSAGFLHQIRPHATQYTLELAELPSMRTGRAPAYTRHLKFNAPESENVAIDRAQSLIVMSHLVRCVFPNVLFGRPLTPPSMLGPKMAWELYYTSVIYGRSANTLELTVVCMTLAQALCLLSTCQ